MTNYTKFVILSTPRSGTTYLVTLLRSHPTIICPGELFDEHVDLGTLTSSPIKKMYHSFFQAVFPGLWLQKYLFRTLPPIISSVGFKLQYYQMQRGIQKNLWGYLVRMHDLRIIHLTRTNLLQQLISLQIAKKRVCSLKEIIDDIHKYQFHLIRWNPNNTLKVWQAMKHVTAIFLPITRY